MSPKNRPQAMKRRVDSKIDHHRFESVSNTQPRQKVTPTLKSKNDGLRGVNICFCGCVISAKIIANEILSKNHSVRFWTSGCFFKKCLEVTRSLFFLRNTNSTFHPIASY
jgi:hypothetical protein